METIKEKKAHEIGWIYSKSYDPVACKQEWCEMAAREGANYVLECIEKVIYNNSTCEKAILELGKLVIQLKK